MEFYFSRENRNKRKQHKMQRAFERKVDDFEHRANELMEASVLRDRLVNDPTIGRKSLEQEFRKTIGAKIAKFLGKMFSSNRSAFGEKSGYNLQRMLNAYETELFVARIIDQYVVSVIQRGYDFIGNDAQSVEYIKKRLFEAEMVSNIKMSDNIGKVTASLLLYGNGFVNVLRGDQSSSGNIWTSFDNKVYQPIAAIDVQDAVSMHIEYDFDKNKVKKYYQNKYNTNETPDAYISGRFFGKYALRRSSTKGGLSQWKPDDMFHIKFHPQAGKLWAMPPFQPVVEDIIALREIEENVQLLCFQYGHPFFHATVDLADPDDRRNEIDILTSNVNNMEGNGFLITGSEVTIELKGSQGKAIEAGQYLQYFQQRVLAGLYTSSLSMGQGSSSNRNTADFIDKQKQEVTKDLQSIIVAGFQPIFDQMLMEAGFDYEYISKNRVSLYFPDPDVDNRIKIEQHAMLLYTANCITSKEMREMMGKKALTEDEDGELYFNKVSKAEAENQIEGQIALAEATAKLNPTTPAIKEEKNSNGNSKTKKSEGANGTAKQTTRPANQYGKKTGPGSIKNSEERIAEMRDLLEEFTKKFSHR